MCVCECVCVYLCIYLYMYINIWIIMGWAQGQCPFEAPGGKDF